MDAHRIEVLDRADDHDVVDVVADDLELELVPAAHRLLDQHLRDRALAQADLDLGAELLARRREAAAVAAERERGPHDRGQGDRVDVLEIRQHTRRRHAEPAALDRLLEQQPVLGALDHVEARADQLDPELVEDAGLRKLAGEIQRRLATHRREQRIGPLAPEDVGNAFMVERLEIRAVGETGVGHDRRGI